MKTILKALVGSRLYGLETEDSDYDYVGVFVRPTEEILAFGNEEDTYVSKNPDTTLHEVRKSMYLAYKCNPTVLEILYARDYTTLTYEGKLLIDNRDMFLNNQVFKSYPGYAYQQVKRLQKRESEGMIGFSPDVAGRREKHARHIFRLFDQGRQLLETGILNPVVSNREELFEVGKLSTKELVEKFEEEDAKFKTIKSILPDKPDFDRINRVLLEIRKINYGN